MALVAGCSGALAAGCDPGSARCGDDELRIDGDCAGAGDSAIAEVHVGFGFLPDRGKLATVPGASTDFAVHREDGSVAFEGTTREGLDGDTGQPLGIADFSAFQETGVFYLEAAGVGRSASFRIAADVFRQPLETALLGLHGQRCGMAVVIEHAGATYEHFECHKNDGWLDFVNGRSEIKSGLGGWHDAGDYGKYTVNGAFSAGLMLAAWEHFGDRLTDIEVPGTSGRLADYLDELAYQIEWLLSMQLPDGSASHKLTALTFEPLDTKPHGDGSKRYFAPVGSAATASLVAAAAMAARIYAPHDAALAERCLAAARSGHAWLDAHAAPVKPDLSAFSTGGYQTGDDDDRLWAAAELWQTTGEAQFLSDFEARARGQSVRVEWDWSEVGNLGLFTYLTSEREGRDPALVAALEASTLDSAERIVETSRRHAYGRGIGSKYYWGINGTVVRTSMNLAVAHRLDPRPEHLDAALQQVAHVLGRNASGRSQVTGVGHRPPRNPHHRPSASDDVPAPWPGLLVGGAWPNALDWKDEQDDYRTNEVALNWNAALVYALAGLLP